jgi:uncharacterized membrane protein YedE/YeeE
MKELLTILSQPWPWYVAGPCIALVLFSLLFFGKSFGVSSNLRTMCAIMGGGKSCSYFDFNWRDQIWNLVFLFGTVIGGYITSQYLMGSNQILISEATISDLTALGIAEPGVGIVPTDLFSWDALFSLRGIVMMLGGGFLIGFGTRYAGGCTSGHAITGLSNLQLPSLIAVVGFFIGGLIMTHFLLPIILAL